MPARACTAQLVVARWHVHVLVATWTCTNYPFLPRFSLVYTCSHVSLECHFCHVLHTDSNYKYTNVPRPLPQARLSTYVEWWRRASLAYTDSTNSPKRTTSQCRPSTSTTRLSRWGGRVHLVSTCLVKLVHWYSVSHTCTCTRTYSRY